MKDVTLLLVPGLGDHKRVFGWFYAGVIKHWRHRGLHGTLVPMNWREAEPLAAKLTRLEAAIAEAHAQGRGVVLVGVSAGAAVALVAFAEHPDRVRGVVSVSGFLRVAPGSQRFRQTPWYQAGLAAEQAATHLTGGQRQRVLALYPRYDATITLEREQLAGGQNRQINAYGHLPSIALGLLRLPGYARRFLASLPANNRGWRLFNHR